MHYAFFAVLLNLVVYVNRAILWAAPSTSTFLLSHFSDKNSLVFSRTQEERDGCICGPNCYGTVVGEWTLHCDDSWTGSGWEPDHECTYTEFKYGDWCSVGEP